MSQNATPTGQPSPEPRPDEWLCPVCGEVVADEVLAGPEPPRHWHHGHYVAFVPRAPTP